MEVVCLFWVLYVSLPTLFACFLGFDIPTSSFILLKMFFIILVQLASIPRVCFNWNSVVLDPSIAVLCFNYLLLLEFCCFSSINSCDVLYIQLASIPGVCFNWNSVVLDPSITVLCFNYFTKSCGVL